MPKYELELSDTKNVVFLFVNGNFPGKNKTQISQSYPANQINTYLVELIPESVPFAGNPCQFAVGVLP